MACTIRTARPDDDLTVFPGMATFRVNRDQVYVAEHHGVIVGMALLFDAGHDLCLVDAVRSLPTAPKGLWVRLLRAILTDVQARGRTVLLGYIDNPRVLQLAAAYGAVVGDRPHYAVCKGVQ